MIVIPMAGMSSRFFKAGYTLPKYQLEAHGKTLFEHAVGSFEHYFDSLPFLFIVRDVLGTPAFVEQMAKKIGIKQYHLVTLENETRGQAETVTEGLKKRNNYQGPITIFNIDTFRPGFVLPENAKDCDGYLEVFQGSGDNWSFVLPENKNTTRITETAEKRAISDLCCTGLYHFHNAKDYLEAYQHYLERPELWEKGELYVAPLYNHLIQKGKNIHYHQIPREDVIFCGVPDEYEEFKVS